MSTEARKTMSLRLSADEMTLLNKLAKKHGDKTAAIVAGLKVLDGAKEPTNTQLLALLKARLGREK
jgi:hypothetical protein